MSYREMIGYRVRKYRESQHLSREKFAEVVHLSSRFITEIENGNKGTSIDSLAKICEACNISADYLIFGKEKELASPLSQTFAKIPPQYTAAAEKMLDSLLEAIAIAAETPSSGEGE